MLVSDTPVLHVTFDDGYADNYEVLLRLLDCGIRPIVFMPTDFIGQKNGWDYSHRLFPVWHLTASDIKELAERGVIFGSHGASHGCLTIMSDDILQEELNRSKKMLEDISGRQVKYLSFPFGRTNHRVNAAALKHGFRRGFLLEPVHKNQSNHDFLVARRPVYVHDDYYSIHAKLRGDVSRLERIKMATINRLSSGTIIVRGRLK